MTRYIPLAISIASAALLSGCASHEYVDRHLAALDTRQLAAVGKVDGKAENAGNTAAAALARGDAAYKLAEGKFLFTITLTDKELSFAPGKAVLSAAGKAHLGELVAKLNAGNKNLYLEIQGHTDDRGNADTKLAIGQSRAEAVRLFLNQQGVALNRMATISYGDSAPVAPNTTEQGRAKNRRVVINVVQ